MTRYAIALLWSLVLVGCATAPYPGPAELRYAGSSTVGMVIRDLAERFPDANVSLDTAGESASALPAIREGAADLAGSAQPIAEAALRAEGIASALIGRDAIATIVHAGLPVRDLRRADLQAIFSGQTRNWQAFGGPDLPIQVFTVAARSATRGVFANAVMPGTRYGEATEVTPDGAIIDRVANTPGAIGHISFSFLGRTAGVRALAIDGEAPAVTNFSYPISRPLYVAWRQGNPAVRRLVDWLLGPDGQQLVMQRFVSSHVIGVETLDADHAEEGFLVVATETEPVLDGGIHYFPHRGYTIHRRSGELVRTVRNRRSPNDETPSRVALPPGTYLIRPETALGSRNEFYVTIRAGAVTRIELPGRRGEPR